MLNHYFILCKSSLFTKEHYVLAHYKNKCISLALWSTPEYLLVHCYCHKGDVFVYVCLLWSQPIRGLQFWVKIGWKWNCCHLPTPNLQTHHIFLKVPLLNWILLGCHANKHKIGPKINNRPDVKQIRIQKWSIINTDGQILCLLTFVVGNQLTLHCKISDNKDKSKGTAHLWWYVRSRDQVPV